MTKNGPRGLLIDAGGVQMGVRKKNNKVRHVIGAFGTVLLFLLLGKEIGNKWEPRKNVCRAANFKRLPLKEELVIVGSYL